MIYRLSSTESACPSCALFVAIRKLCINGVHTCTIITRHHARVTYPELKPLHMYWAELCRDNDTCVSSFKRCALLDPCDASIVSFTDGRPEYHSVHRVFNQIQQKYSQAHSGTRQCISVQKAVHSVR
jgi:hypothetical protein